MHLRTEPRPAGSGLLPALAALPVMLLLAGCSSPAPERKAEPAPPVAVRAETLKVRTVPETYEATGTVKARVTTTVSSRLMGHVLEVRVQAGDHVTAGQTIAVVDAREIETSLRQAEAARSEARGAVPEVDNSIAAARAQLELAQATQRRMKTLFDQKSITPQEMDEVNAKTRMAEANLEMTQARKVQLQQKVRQADEAIAAVNIQKGYAHVAAPFAGIVVERKAEPGTLAAPGTPIAVIEQAGSYRLEAAVEEARLGSVRAGMPVQVELDAFDRVLSGRVTEIVPALDPASRTFTVKIELPGGLPLRTGLFGRARFQFGEKPALLAPVSAVVSDGQIRRVFVVSQGMARVRLITTGAGHADRVEVLSGLTEGETVVAPVPATLADGARVEVRP